MQNLDKEAIAGALSWSGMSTWLGRRSRTMPLILGYHRVVEHVPVQRGRTLPAMTVTQQTLRAHLEWVGRRFRFVSLDELGALLERHAPCGNLAAVTFDDGYRDVADYALPVLEQLGVPAGIFVVSSLIDTKSAPLHDQLYQLLLEAVATERPIPAALASLLDDDHLARLDDPNALLYAVRSLLSSTPASELRDIVDELHAHGSWTAPPTELATVDWQALAALRRAGVIVGSHSHTHALLTREDDATVCEELTRSRAVLEAGLGAPVRHFAYPDGRFSTHVVRAVAAAGYRYAYTICDHRDHENPLLTIPRVMLWEGSCRGVSGEFSPSLMDCHAAGVLPFPSRCRDDHGLRAWWLSC